MITVLNRDLNQDYRLGKIESNTLPSYRTKTQWKRD
jgi:hypothetical protein